MKQSVLIFFVCINMISLKSNSQVYHCGLQNGAKLRISHADNEAWIYVTPQGGAESLASHLDFLHNNPYRNDFITIIPVISTFGKLYTVRIVLLNEDNDRNINPMSLNAKLYAVTDDNVVQENASGNVLLYQIDFLTPGSGYSKATKEFIFQVQKN